MNLDVAPRTSSRLVHVVRLGNAKAPIGQYLRGHEDAVSWTADVGAAIAFPTAEAAKRFAARRLGGAWHVHAVDRSGFRAVLQVLDEVDAYPEPGCRHGVTQAVARAA